MPEEIKRNLNAWAACVAGALEKREYVNTIKKAGFRDVSIVSKNAFYVQGLDDSLAGKIISVKIRAYK